MFSTRIVSPLAKASSKAITSCVGNTRLSRLKLIFCRPLLRKLALVSTSFANLAIDQILEGTLKWFPID